MQWVSQLIHLNTHERYAKAYTLLNLSNIKGVFHSSFAQAVHQRGKSREEFMHFGFINEYMNIVIILILAIYILILKITGHVWATE